MERLKKAMERARVERQTRGTPGSDRGSLGERGARPRARPSSEGLTIDYTRTTRISVDPDALRDARIILAPGSENVADAYKVLRTQVLQRMRARGMSTLAITSPRPGAGKTTTAINLAISLARDVNQTVLLVDLDLKRPAIASYFGNETDLGISDYLVSDVDLADILFTPGIERLVVLPGREQIAQSSEILLSPRFLGLLDELKTRYDDRIVLFDMPPIFAGDDVIALLPHVDGVMLVIEEGKVSRTELQQAEQLLGEKSIGLAINKAEEGSTSGGYY